MVVKFYALFLCIVYAVTFPLDITKTRLQIQGQREQSLAKGQNGQSTRPAYRGMLRTLIGISTYTCTCIWNAFNMHSTVGVGF